MVIDAKATITKDFIRTVYRDYHAPVVLWSGGKDSMVMLHLVFEVGITPVILQYRNPFFPRKYVFTERVIREWRLTVFDYPPIAMGLKEKNGNIELVHLYQIGLKKHLHLPTNMQPIKGQDDWRCGVEMLARPKATIAFPWDVLLIGHKNCDTDVTEGSVPLHTDLHHNEGAPDLAFPLRDWSHEEVWAYTEQHHLPVQESRYEKREDGTWGEREDKTYNSDHTPICIRCLDKREPDRVWCPKFERAIANISALAPYLPPHGLTYFGEPTLVAQEA